MIRWLNFVIFGKTEKSPYECGREYALSELQRFGGEVKARLYAESDGALNSSQRERDFDRGMLDAISDFNAQQKEIVRNMLK